MNNQQLKCCEHANQAPVMACVHISRKTVLKILWVAADGDDPKTAWCAVCEKARIKDRGWYDYADSVAQWCWVCGGCFLARASKALSVKQLPGTRAEG